MPPPRRPPYKFQRLPRNGRAIRLLELFPGSQSDPIRLSISQRRFTTKNFPEYEALSYTWGSEEDLIPVEVKAPKKCVLKEAFRHSKYASTETDLNHVSWAIIDIGQNLYEALSHLRLERTSRVLWVDAICINQQDVAEKGREVRNMGDIYRLAKCVLVWLGPASADSSLAVKTLSYLGSQVRLELGWNTNYAADGAEEPTWIKHEVALPYSRATWNAIASFLDRQWFKRVWIWQEILLANSSARLICGTDEILWKKLQGALWTITYKRENPLMEDPISEKNLGRAFALASVRKETSFLNLLEYLRSSFCKDQRDRIYAVLSLAWDNEVFKIIPDYTYDVYDIYYGFTSTWMRVHRSLLFLMSCNDQPLSTDPRWATWVPNWSNPPATRNSLSMNACATEGPFINFRWFGENHHDCLEVKGRFLGTIVHCGDPAPPTPSMEQVLELVRSWEPEYLLTADYPSGCKLFDAFLSVLVDGHFSPRTPVKEDPTLAQAKEEYLQVIRGGNVPDMAASIPIQNLYNDLNRFVSGRTFFTTDNGYVGLGTSHARPGDCIAVLLGYNNPIVLRPAVWLFPDRYQVLGDCNLEGFRDLEALLGPLPDGWHVEDQDIQNQWCMYFVDMRPGTLGGRQGTFNDPRLSGCPPGYKIVYDSESRKTFISDEDGRVYLGDPRLSDGEFLRARGVDIKDIVLV
jgi:hypothetical protein